MYDHHLALSKETVAFKSRRDVWWHEAVKSQPITCPIVKMDAEDTLFKLYTSGSTGREDPIRWEVGGGHWKVGGCHWKAEHFLV